MQYQDLLTLSPLDLLDPTTAVPVPPGETSDEPSLRYEVESLQHWLDLNA